jgi:hypothetical protein
VKITEQLDKETQEREFYYKKAATLPSKISERTAMMRTENFP